MNRIRHALVLAALTFWCVLASGGLGVWSAWALAPRQPFSHYADQQELTEILAAFARDQHLNVTFSPMVKGKASGRFEAVPAMEFLNGMKAAFGVGWYEQGGAIHFFHESELSRIFISPRVVSGQNLYNMLRQASVLAPQLPAQVMSGGAMLLISGPPAYLAQVQSAVAAFEAAQTSNFVMRVFPLKYAWAEDIRVNSMDSTVTIPGIATILKAMVTGAPLTSSTITQAPAAQTRLGGQGLITVGQQPAAPAAQPAAAPSSSAAGQGGQSDQQVNIIADPRVNAVLVTDAAYRMPYYEKVIADLDKPVELVEIHAAIVDIDSNFQRDLGLSLQGSANTGKWNLGGEISTSSEDISTKPSAGSLLGGGLTLSTLYSNGADFFLSRIQALEADGAARMLGRPSVLTMDNVQATLENTSTYYISVEGKDVADLFKVEAGTVLKVTPHIIPGSTPDASGHVRDSIKLVVSVQDDQNDDTSTDNVGVLPPIKQTKINTQAIVAEGQSLLIGGYYYERQSETDSGVPGIKDVPVLGNLFKTTGKVNKRMERLILITPRVVRLNDLPLPPARVDDPRFHRSALQPDYEERVPTATPVGGCSRKRVNAPAPAVQSPAAAEPLYSPSTLTVQPLHSTATRPRWSPGFAPSADARRSLQEARG